MEKDFVQRREEIDFRVAILVENLILERFKDHGF